MRSLTRSVLLLGVLLLPAFAQAQTTLAGVVRDASGAVLPGVTVEASSSALIERTRSTVTDENGQYQIVNLRPGTYALKFTLTGFTTIERDGVQVAGGGVIGITPNCGSPRWKKRSS